MLCLLVTNSGYLGSGGGGVQWCTREYLDTFYAAGISVSKLPFEISRRPLARMRRRLFPSPFKCLHDPRLIDEILSTVRLQEIDWIFLNNMDAAILAPKLRAASPDLKVVYLSHGVELTDVVNNLRLAKGSISPSDRSGKWLGDLIKLEISIRNAVDAVICISEADQFFEQWLGSARTLFIPRQIPLNPLPLQPVAGRIGTVSTLDHGPNFDGIRRLATELERADGVELRLVGGPENIGRELESQFRSIRYLGRLSNAEFENEAATWCVFVNPIFSQARGASTKVATALGWGLPVMTTPHGARGYRWDQQALPLSDSPGTLADACKKFATVGARHDGSGRSKVIADLAPSPNEAAEMLRVFLNY